LLKCSKKNFQDQILQQLLLLLNMKLSRGIAAISKFKIQIRNINLNYKYEIAAAQYEIITTHCCSFASSPRQFETNPLVAKWIKFKKSI